MEKLEKLHENTFLLTAVVVVRRDRVVKQALDSQKMNDN